MIIPRAEIAAQIEAWRDGAIAVDQLLAWVAARWPKGDVEADDVARAALDELDLLLVHLLTPDDAPSLLALLAARDADSAAAIDTFRRHRASIDRVTRSRALRKHPLYRPFCR